jgi:hypothetical protein
MSKLLTPLVIGTTFVVMALSVARLLLMPDAWISSLLALLFLPLVVSGLLAQQHTRVKSMSAVRVSGKLRAGLVGAGVLLATALSESMIETLGLIPERKDGIGVVLLVALPAVVAVAIDLFSARLESKAEQERD